MENKSEVKMIIDGQELHVDPGLTVLDAARQNNIRIPTLCHHPALSNWGGCRLCMVQIDGSPKMAASCVTPVREGMDVVTHNDQIHAYRKTILEFLFAERNHNCMFCSQSGDCELQALAYEYQMDHLTVVHSEKSFSVDTHHPYLALDHNRCILCGRCVRACREISGNYIINFKNRGSRSLISLDLDETRDQSACTGCGVCAQVCPTGALYNRYATHYAVKGHTKDWKVIETICPECGYLCPTQVRVRDNRVIKIDGLLSVNGNRPDKGQLCARGRFEVLKQEKSRLLHAMLKNADHNWQKVSYETALETVKQRLCQGHTFESENGILGIASSCCSNEELFLFSQLIPTNGIKNIDTLDGPVLSAIKAFYNKPMSHQPEISLTKIPEADFILVLGENDFATQPILLFLIRRSLIEKGLVLAMAGLSDVFTPFTRYFFPMNVEQINLFVKALQLELTRLAGIDSAFKKSNSSELLEDIGCDDTAIEKFFEMAAQMANSKSPVMIVGSQAVCDIDPEAMGNIRRMMSKKSFDHDRTLNMVFIKPFGNSAGALKLGIPGQLESESPKAGILLLAGNETITPELLTVLNNLEFLAVIAPYFNDELAQVAHVFIPRPILLEENGTFTGSDGLKTAFKPKVIDAPPKVRMTWQTLLALMEDKDKVDDWDDVQTVTDNAINNFKS